MLTANKIALYITKTDIVFFQTKHKPWDTESKLKLHRKILNKTNHVRHLGIAIYENLNWKTHAHDLLSKLNRANSVS